MRLIEICRFRLVPQKSSVMVPFCGRKIFFTELMLLFDGKSPMFVIGYYPTEIRLYGILLPTFYILMSIIDPKIGHTGLFCNPKLF